MRAARTGVAKLRKDLRSFAFDNGMVLLDKRTNRLFAYNQSAAVVWQALIGGARSPDTAIDAVSKTYGMSTEEASRDVAGIMEHWQSVGLLDRTARTPQVNAEAVSPNVPNRTEIGQAVSGLRTQIVPRERASIAAADAVNPLQATYEFGGCAFQVTVEDPDVAPRVQSLLRTYRVESSGAAQDIDVRKDGAGDLVLRKDGREILRTDSSAEMTGALFQTLLSSTHAIDDWLAIIHGGAVAAQGRAILLPGASRSGKSTLGAFLVSRGFDYLSDDMIAVTSAGGIATWPIPISIKRGSWSALAPYLPELEAIPATRVWNRTIKYLPVPSASWGRLPSPAGLIIFPKFNRAAQASSLTLLRPIEALQRLISDRIWLGYPLRAEAVDSFLNWLSRMRCYELSYGSFEAVEGLVREAAEQRI